MSGDIEAVTYTLRRLQAEMEDLSVGGLRAVGPERAPALLGLSSELERVGAAHVAERLRVLAESMRDGESSAAGALLRAQASLRVFERVLTLRWVEGSLDVPSEPEEDDEDDL